MSYYGESRIVQVHPGRDLAVRHDVHVTHPRRMRLHGAQRVTQLLVVLKATRRDVLILPTLQHKRIKHLVVQPSHSK